MVEKYVPVTGTLTLKYFGETDDLSYFGVMKDSVVTLQSNLYQGSGKGLRFDTEDGCVWVSAESLQAVEFEETKSIAKAASKPAATK